MAGSKLTKAQREVLTAIPDWSARYEVRERLGRKLTGLPCRTARDLDDLVSRGLAKFSVANATYRITDAGRAVGTPEAKPAEAEAEDETP